jgi:hypothetical protein
MKYFLDLRAIFVLVLHRVIRYSRIKLTVVFIIYLLSCIVENFLIKLVSIISHSYNQKYLSIRIFTIIEALIYLDDFSIQKVMHQELQQLHTIQEKGVLSQPQHLQLC